MSSALRGARFSIVAVTISAAVATLVVAASDDLREDVLTSLGTHETTGAAPGYVDDPVCSECHAEIADSYAQVAMSRSFSRPSNAIEIESFGGKPFVHEKSRQHFEVTKRDGTLLFRRWQVAADGRPINVFEQTVDWILGSGIHARTYLYRTPSGELYQLPIAWYSESGRWGMAPGYDRADHEGVSRRVRHECMFCHNAYPEIAADTLGYWRSQSFPQTLPHGIGCQRCHGPGAKHVRSAFEGTEDDAKRSIVNPAATSSSLSRDVCYGCHMQPVVAVPGVRRFGRDVYAFRPGETLSEYMLHLDVEDRSRTRDERFEINHHPYRLEQSACFSKSEGKLSCLSCHDPHRKVAADERASHYRNVCSTCHSSSSCSGTHGDEPADCVSCHMPKRRTQDVVHAVMTDHRIGRVPGGVDLLAPLAESEPSFDELFFLDRKQAPAGSEADAYRAVAVLRATGGTSRAALARLEQALDGAKNVPVEPYLDLAMAQLRQRKLAAFEATAASIVSRDLRNSQAIEWLGVARWAAGKKDEGLALIDSALEVDPSREETLFNRGLLTATLGKAGEAAVYFEKAVALRPSFAAAWHHLGEARLAQGKKAEAIAAYKRALEIDPRRTDSYAAIVGALESAGNRAEAERFRHHGATAAANPALLEELLERRAGKTPE